MQAALRKNIQALSAQRDSLELEAHAIKSELDAPVLGEDGRQHPPPGLKLSMVDAEGFPRAEYDIFRVRTLRHRYACIQTDHKDLMKRLEEAIHELHAISRPSDSHETAPGSQQGQTASEKQQASSKTAQLDAMDLDTSDGPLASVPFAKINSVEEGSPAAAGGIMKDDLVLSFGAIHHANHEGLRGIVREVHAGKLVHVWVQRGGESGEIIRLDVTPGTWGGAGLLGCHLLPM